MLLLLREYFGMCKQSRRDECYVLLLQFNGCIEFSWLNQYGLRYIALFQLRGGLRYITEEDVLLHIALSSFCRLQTGEIAS